MDITKILDVEQSIKNLGMADLYYMVLPKFEDMVLTKYMKPLAEAYTNKDWVELKENAHAIKGASGYLGAAKLHYACYYM